MLLRGSHVRWGLKNRLAKVNHSFHENGCQIAEYSNSPTSVVGIKEMSRPFGFLYELRLRSSKTNRWYKVKSLGFDIRRH